MRTPVIEAYAGCFCPHCAAQSYIVEVHGLVQCGQCNQPLLNCSEGAPAHDPGLNATWRPPDPPETPTRRVA